MLARVRPTTTYEINATEKTAGTLLFLFASALGIICVWLVMFRARRQAVLTPETHVGDLMLIQRSARATSGPKATMRAPVTAIAPATRTNGIETCMAPPSISKPAMAPV